MSTPPPVRATPVLPVGDVEKAVEWYRDALGFRVGHVNRDLEGDEPTNYAVLHGDGSEVHLVHAPEVARSPGAGMCVLRVTELDELFQALRRRGVRILQPVTERPWGTRECWIEDPFGTRIVLSEPQRAVP